MLMTAKPKKGGDGIGGHSRAGHGGSEMDDVEIDSGEVKVDEVGKKARNSSKSKNSFKSQKTVRSDFFILRAKLAFTKLRQTFLKTPILHHFDPERHIRIKTDVSRYAIGGFLSQLTSDDLGR